MAPSGTEKKELARPASQMTLPEVPVIVTFPVITIAVVNVQSKPAANTTAPEPPGKAAMVDLASAQLCAIGLNGVGGGVDMHGHTAGILQQKSMFCLDPSLQMKVTVPGH